MVNQARSPNVWQFSDLKVTALRAALANSPILYEDDFATFNPGWGDPDEAVGVKDGKLAIAPSADRWRAALNQSNVFDDADIAVEASHVRG